MASKTVIRPIAGAFHTKNILLRSGLLFIEGQKPIAKTAFLFHATAIFDALSKVMFLRKFDT